jgi:hypothetical protein
MSGQDSIYFVFWILGALVAVGIFVVLRAFVLWYWGITEHLANQKRIIELLERTATPQPTARPPALGSGQSSGRSHP